MLASLKSTVLGTPVVFLPPVLQRLLVSRTHLSTAGGMVSIITLASPFELKTFFAKGSKAVIRPYLVVSSLPFITSYHYGVSTSSRKFLLSYCRSYLTAILIPQSLTSYMILLNVSRASFALSPSVTFTSMYSSPGTII